MQTIQSSRQLTPLLTVRFIFILLQLIAVLASTYWLDYELNTSALFGIISLELLLNFAFYCYYRTNRSISSWSFFYQCAFDIIFLTLILYFSGGATNPFVSLLLLPIAITAVSATKQQMLLTSLLAVLSYSGLLFTLSPHALHHMDMEHHLIGMWLNFVLSALVVVVIVASLITALNRQERKWREQREEQLKQEQIIAMGTAAAQFAHRLATPLGTAHLLTEELLEKNTNLQISQDLKQQLNECRRHLDGFRQTAENIKHNHKAYIPVADLLAQLQLEIQLNLPALQVDLQNVNANGYSIATNPTLLPALLNLVHNAAQASKTNHKQEVEISLSLADQHLVMIIRDFGHGFSDEDLMQLGSELVDSRQGLGMGVFLSHATLEQIGAKLRLYNHHQAGAVAEVTLAVKSAGKV